MFLDPEEKAKRRLARERTTMRSGRAALRKIQELPEQYVPEGETHHHRVCTTPEGRQQKEEALEILEKKLQSLASLKANLSHPQRGDVIKKRRQIDRYLEIVRRLVLERRKKTTWPRIQKKYVQKKQEEVHVEEEEEKKEEEEIEVKEMRGEEKAVQETFEKVEQELEPAQKITEEEKPSKGKKREKKSKEGKRKTKQNKEKKKKQKEKEGKNKEKKGRKKSAKDKKDELKEEISTVCIPPGREIVPAEDVLEPFQVELLAPPSTPHSPDPYLQVVPQTVVFKDFVCGRRYVKTVHVRNVGSRSVKCWLQDLIHDGNDDVIEVSGPESCFTLLTGLAMSVRVFFCPQQDTQGVTAQLTLRTRRPDSPEREISVRVRCEPNQAEPTITPLDLTIPMGSQWGSVLVDNKGGRSCTLSIENLPLLESGDVLDHILDNVFREFQFDKKYCIHVGARERVRVRVKFSPRGAPGPREEKFLFRFEEAPPQEVTVRAVMSPNPVVVTPLQLDMGLCLSDDHVIQQGFYVTNTSRAPVAITAHAQHLSVIPSHCLLQAGKTMRMCVRLVTSLQGDLDLPVVVRAAEHVTVVKVFAVSCARSSISIVPEHIDLGIVTSGETVSCALELRNNTLAAHKFGFLDLPAGVAVQPGDGFGTILPEEKVSLQLLFSPNVVHSFVTRCHTQSGATATVNCVASVIHPECRFVPSSITFPPTPCGSYFVVRAKLRALQDTKFELKSPSEELLVIPCSGRLQQGQEMTVLVVLRPEREENRAERITCVTDTTWLQVPVAWSVSAPHFVLEGDSPQLEFGAVALGTTCTSQLRLHNTENESISIVTSLLNPLGPFCCPLGPARVDPGQALVLPITFRPQVLEEFQQEYLEVRGSNTVLSLMLSGHGVEHRLTFHPDQLLYRFDGTTGTVSLEMRNLCAASLPIQVRQVFARQGPAPKQDKKEKKKKGKSESTLKPEIEEIIEGLSPAESAFSVEPRQLTIQANQRAVVKVQYEARAPCTMHAARFNISLSHSFSLRQLTFLGTSATLKKKRAEKSKQSPKKDKPKEKKNKK